MAYLVLFLVLWMVFSRLGADRPSVATRIRETENLDPYDPDDRQVAEFLAALRVIDLLFWYDPHAGRFRLRMEEGLPRQTMQALVRQAVGR